MRKLSAEQARTLYRTLKEATELSLRVGELSEIEKRMIQAASGMSAYPHKYNKIQSEAMKKNWTYGRLLETINDYTHKNSIQPTIESDQIYELLSQLKNSEK